MKSKELNLDEIDALLGEDEFGSDVEEDSNDFDALLGDDEEVSEEISEEDSLEELLGAIDNDYLTAEEQVFLKNKEFMSSKNPTELDSFFMEFQETLYGAMSEMCKEDEFGADDLDDMELGADLCVGHEFGSDEDAEIFFEEAVISGECMGLDPEEEFGVAGIGLVAAGAAARRKVRRKVAKKISPKKALVATKKKYLREMNRLERCVKQFKRKAKKLNPDVAIKIVAGKSAFLKRPFSVMAAASAQKDSLIVDALKGKKLNLKDRRLVASAKKCDEQYDQLRRVWVTLKSKGKTAGLKPPHAVFDDIIASYTKSSKKAMKKAGGAVAAVAAATVAKSKTVSAKRADRKESRLAKRADRKESRLAKRADRKESRLAKRKAAKELSEIRKVAKEAKRQEVAERRKKRVLAARQFVKAKKETAAEAIKKAKISRVSRRPVGKRKTADHAKMVKANPYMDEADLKALQRADKAMAKPGAVEQIKADQERKLKYLEKLLSRSKKKHAQALAAQNQHTPGSAIYQSLYKKTKRYASEIVNYTNQIADLKRKMVL